MGLPRDGQVSGAHPAAIMLNRHRLGPDGRWSDFFFETQ